MNVLALVTYRIYPTLMGGQKGVALFYKYLQQELNVRLAVSKNNGEENSVPVISKKLFPNKTIFANLFRIGHLKKLVRAENIDILIAEHSYTGWMAWLLRRATGLPFVIHSHNLEALRFKQMNRWWWRFYQPYERWIHQQADHNFFISAEDEQYARQAFKLDSEKCSVITYGVEPVIDTSFDKNSFLKQYGINEKETVFYFNGTLDYEPNIEALRNLVNEIIPLLEQSFSNFKILITGNRVSPELLNWINKQPRLQFLGYVPDVRAVYKAAQLFLNPIQEASGVKTKVIEAIACGCTVISTMAGASGIDHKACGEKLIVMRDEDWIAFADAVKQGVKKQNTQTADIFFKTYGWSKIAGKAAHKLNAVVKQHAAKLP